MENFQPTPASVLKGRDQPVGDNAELIKLNPGTGAIISEARARGLDIEQLWGSVIAIHNGSYSARTYGTITEYTNYLAVMLAGNKQATKNLLQKHGLPVCPGDLARSAQDCLKIHAALNCAVAIKPNKGAQGYGVSTNLTKEDDLLGAYTRATKSGGSVVVERSHPGRDFRFLVVRDHVVAVAERARPAILGDGSHSIIDLVAKLNDDPKRSAGHISEMTLVEVDLELHAVLVSQGLSLDSIPPPGMTVYLRWAASMSRGGTASDVTDIMHPSISEMAAQAAHVVGLDVAGVDIVLSSPLLPLDQSDAEILEVNASPGLRIHLMPAYGDGRNVAAPILDYLIHMSNCDK